MVIYPVDSAIHRLNNWDLSPVVQKPINATPRLKINQGVYSKMPFNADIRQNFTLEEVNLEKQKNLSPKC